MQIGLLKLGKVCVSAMKKSSYTSAKEVEKAVVNAINEILHEDEWVIKKVRIQRLFLYV